MRKWKNSENSWKVLWNKLQLLLLWIIAMVIAVFFFLAPFLVLVIMKDNVDSGVVYPDMDVEEQINTETIIQ